ncbi:MAG: DUF47 family protein [Deltaproteobacteria bacterium]|nr:DUF47 family protein [Deltaproteobacteria bacterium]MBW2136410.1 DUF47 family protein [Deltaproteobacteria bacterium]
MFRFFFKKQREIEALIYKYLDTLRETRKHFVEALEICLKTGPCEDFDFLIEQTHKFESRADDTREEINSLMYGKALIPESRGDIMELLQALDLIPGLFEHILYMIKIQKIEIPGFISSNLQELIDVSLEGVDLLLSQVENLFKEGGEIRDLVLEIDKKESRCDHIQRNLMAKVFDSDLDPFHKIQLKDMVNQMGEISDQADNVSKLVHILSMKRRV